MKNLVILIVLVILTAFVSPFINVEATVTWLNGTTYVHGHDVAGSLPNWMALICLAGPLVVFMSSIVIAHAKYTMKTKRVL